MHGAFDTHLGVALVHVRASEAADHRVKVVAVSHLPEVHTGKLFVGVVPPFHDIAKGFLYQLKRVGPKGREIADKAAVLPQLEIRIQAVIRIRDDLRERHPSEDEHNSKNESEVHLLVSTRTPVMLHLQQECQVRSTE